MDDEAKKILKSMLDEVPEEFYKGEGELVFDILAPAAIELEKRYRYSEKDFDRNFADTAMGVDLDRVCANSGVERKQGIYSGGSVKVNGAVGAVIYKDMLVASDSLNFIVQEEKLIGLAGFSEVNIICEKVGAVGNVPVGAIKYFPLSVDGLYSVVNETFFSNGKDEENDRELRDRFYGAVQRPSTSGNVFQYEKWAMEVAEVGRAKCKSTWDGPGTVKVIVIDGDKHPATEEIVKKTFDYIETVRPVGAEVTVVTPAAKVIDIDVVASIGNNVLLNQVKQSFAEKVNGYFEEIALRKSFVSYAILGGLLLDVLGVVDYSDLLINGLSTNIVVGEDEIPMLGDMEVRV